MTNKIKVVSSEMVKGYSMDLSMVPVYRETVVEVPGAGTYLVESWPNGNHYVYSRYMPRRNMRRCGLRGRIIAAVLAACPPA